MHSHWWSLALEKRSSEEAGQSDLLHTSAFIDSTMCVIEAATASHLAWQQEVPYADVVVTAERAVPCTIAPCSCVAVMIMIAVLWFLVAVMLILTAVYGMGQ